MLIAGRVDFQTLVRETSDSLHAYLPQPNNLRRKLVISSGASRMNPISKLEALCEELEGVSHSLLSENHLSNDYVIKIWGYENTWSRKARRKREQMGGQNGSADVRTKTHSEAQGTSNLAEAKVVMFVRGSIEKESGVHLAVSSDIVWIVEASWSRGGDRELFESLWNHLSRKLYDKVSTKCLNEMEP